jgi:hypothetical protein
MLLNASGMIFLVSMAACLGTAIWLERRVSQRSHPGEGRNVLMVFLMLMVISMFASLAFATGQQLFALVSKPSYSATVVGHTSEYVDYEETNSSGRTESGQRLMHTAQVRFTGPDGVSLELPSSLSAAEVPRDGSRLTVVYAPGDQRVAELSTRSVGLWLGACVMLCILGYFLWATVWYALGRPMAGVRAVQRAQQ